MRWLRVSNLPLMIQVVNVKEQAGNNKNIILVSFYQITIF